jgi:hypothetical protein
MDVAATRCNSEYTHTLGLRHLAALEIERPVWELLRKEKLLTQLLQKRLHKGPMVTFLLSRGHKKNVGNQRLHELTQLILSKYVIEGGREVAPEVRAKSLSCKTLFAAP